MGLFSLIAFLSLVFSSSKGCLYDRNWQPLNMTMRATVADHVIAGRVDSVFTGNMHYTAKLSIFCVYQTNGDVTKLPRTVNITVSTARFPSCAESMPDLDFGRSYIVLLSGSIETGELYAMTVNAQKAEFNLTQHNIDDLYQVFGSGIRMEGTSINDSAGPRNCPSDVETMIMLGDEDINREEDEDEDAEEEAVMSTKVPSELKYRTVVPDGDMKTGDGEDITETPTNGVDLVVGIPTLTLAVAVVTFVRLW